MAEHAQRTAALGKGEAVTSSAARKFKSLLLFSKFLRIGASSFGSATTENIRQLIVEENALLSAGEFRDCITLTGFIPGPFHVNLACITGYRIAGFKGSLGAVIGYIFPGFVIVLLLGQFMAISEVRGLLEKSPGIINGMIAGVCGLLLNAIFELGNRTIEERSDWLLVFLLAAFLFCFRIPFILIASALGCYFYLRARYRRRQTRP